VRGAAGLKSQAAQSSPQAAHRRASRVELAAVTQEIDNGTRHGEVVQSNQGLGFIQPQGGDGRDVFVHISAVERAGLSTLNEGQQVEYEIEENRGKTSAVNLKVK
jgi:cold shock protein